MNCIINGLHHYIAQLSAMNADANAVSFSGESALSLAIASSNYHMIDELARVGNVDTEIVIGDLGRTPLHHSIMNDNDNALVKLLEMKANINAQDAEGNTPLHLAMINQSDSLGAYLLKRGALLDLPNEDGDTPLHLAESLERKKLALDLIALGANSALPNKAGKTAAALSAERGAKSQTHLDEQTQAARRRKEAKSEKLHEELHAFLSSNVRDACAWREHARARERARACVRVRVACVFGWGCLWCTQAHRRCGCRQGLQTLGRTRVCVGAQGLERHLDFFVERKFNLSRLLGLNEKKLKVKTAPPCEGLVCSGLKPVLVLGISCCRLSGNELKTASGAADGFEHQSGVGVVGTINVCARARCRLRCAPV